MVRENEIRDFSMTYEQRMGWQKAGSPEDVAEWLEGQKLVARSGEFKFIRRKNSDDSLSSFAEHGIIKGKNAYKNFGELSRYWHSKYRVSIHEDVKKAGL